MPGSPFEKKNIKKRIILVLLNLLCKDAKKTNKTLIEPEKALYKL